MKTQDPREQLSGLQEQQLFDLARNESARWLYRKIAAGLLKEKGYLKANHPEIASVLAAFLAEVVAVQHESEVSDPAKVAQVVAQTSPITAQVIYTPTEKSGEWEKMVDVHLAATENGALKASVTTETMSASPVIENEK